MLDFEAIDLDTFRQPRDGIKNSPLGNVEGKKRRIPDPDLNQGFRWQDRACFGFTLGRGAADTLSLPLPKAFLATFLLLTELKFKKLGI